MRIFCIGDHICLHWQLVILRNLWRNIERLNKPFVCGSVVWKMLGFVLGQSLSYFTCMNKDENLLLKCKLRVSYSRIHCKPSQKAGKRLRRTSLYVSCRSTSSDSEQQLTCSRWLRDMQNIVTLLLVSGLIPSPLVNVSGAAASSSSTMYNVEKYEGHPSVLESAIWQDSDSQITTSVERWERESALTKASAKLPLYPSLVSDSFIGDSNSGNAMRNDMFQVRDYKGKFSWSNWFRAEDSSTVVEEETGKSGKKGRYIFVIVTLLVIACVVPMIQYYSYAK